MPQHLGNIIAHLRGRFTQKEIAAKLGMKQQQYARIEKRKKIDDALLERIAALIGYTPEYIKNFSLNHENKGPENISEVKRLYDQMLFEKERIIKLLRETIRFKNKQIKELREKK